MAYATIDDLLQVEPNITEFGVIDWEIELERSEREVNRVLTVRWWQDYQRKHPRIQNTDIRTDLLDPTQFTMAVVYHSLAYHICPKLTQFSGTDPDKFQVMMDYYRGRFEHEMDLVLREGVRYDLDDDSEFERSETGRIDSLRLRR
jgi:hypothetical protein